jgi:hypothetical protein
MIPMELLDAVKWFWDASKAFAEKAAGEKGNKKGEKLY